jgi:hypothetical protein
MNHVNQRRTCLDYRRLRQLGRPITLVNIPPDGDHGCQGAELVDDFRLAKVARMDDEIATLQGN